MATILPRGLDAAPAPPERTHTFRPRLCHCRLPRRPDRPGDDGVRCANPEPALTQRRPLVLVAGGALGGGADAARTPLAHSPRAMQASLDTLFGLHNHEP
jgi:hypothetical protein